MTGLDQQWVEANLEQFFELWQRVLGKKQTESRLGPSTRHDTIRLDAAIGPRALL